MALAQSRLSLPKHFAPRGKSRRSAHGASLISAVGLLALLPRCGDSQSDSPDGSTETPEEAGGEASTSSGGESQNSGGAASEGGSSSGGASSATGGACDAACRCDEAPTSCVVDHDVDCTIAGLAFGPFIEEGESPGVPVTRAQALERVAMIADTTDAIRTYGCRGDREVARAAKEMGLSVSMGAFLTENEEENAAELECLIEVCNEGYCDAAIVGNEFEFTGTTVQQLVDGIAEVRAALDTPVPITTAVVLGSYAAHPELVSAVDQLYVHIYPSLAGYPVEHATSYIHAAYHSVREVSGDKPIVISETGWPTAGSLPPGTFGEIDFNEADAAAYLKNFVTWAEAELREQDSYFYFEAMDEPWKASIEGTHGAHWGIANAGVFKEGVDETLACERTTPHWGTERIPDESTVGQPALAITDTPAIGSEDPICGTSNFIVPADSRILVYVNTKFGWWGPKSYDRSALVFGDGTWCSRYASPGTGDINAEEIGVFLVENTFEPLQVEGLGALPAALTDAALAEVYVNR